MKWCFREFKNTFINFDIFYDWYNLDMKIEKIAIERCQKNNIKYN